MIKRKKALIKISRSTNPMARLTVGAMRILPRWVQLRMLSIRKEGKLVGLIKEIKKERCFSMWPDEMANVFNFAAAATKLAGDFAEVGVYRGGSAKLICEAKGERPLHLFDTFEGLPPTGDHDWSFVTSQYAESLAAVQSYLQRDEYPNVFFYKGLFPETAKSVENKTFALVHLDVDLLSSTLDALKFFYPRMEKAGIILSHDFSTALGVRKAFHDYFADKPEPVFELGTSQCFAVKA
jgi:O-methyltransferase